MNFSDKETTQHTPGEKIPFWHDSDKRAIIYQAAIFAIVVLIGYFLVSNTMANLRTQKIATGFGFLKKEAAFEIGESLIPYSASDTYTRVLIAGVLNTLYVSVLGMGLTMVFGTFLGIARLSSNWLLSRAAIVYIEAFQNVPVLLQLFFWYSFFYELLPPPRQAVSPIPGVFLSNRGMMFPVPERHPAYLYAAIAFVCVCIIAYVLRVVMTKRQERTGQAFPIFWTSVALLLGVPLMAWWLGGAPTQLSVPALKGFNFQGGKSVSPEFTALLLGLVMYTSAFVAEIVRAGIQSVSRGQTEAAMSIGLKPGQILSLVILPQALRVIIPPLTSQLLNLTKNSSLAIAIGFPDFVSVAGTTINQTGQAIEGVLLIMIVYLCFSLSTSAFMNWYNKKIALVER